MATKFHFNEHNTAKRNSSIALNTAKSVWKQEFSESEKKTWKDHSPFNNNNTIKDSDGQLHFLHVVMQLFALTNSNTQAFTTISLVNLQDRSSTQQSSWEWSAR